MEQIVIKRSPTADSRTCDFSKVTKEQLLTSSRKHISDVRQGLEYYAGLLREAGTLHDRDKLTSIDEFHKDFYTGFKTRDWYQDHLKVNRHHLQEEDGVPDDVNLVDVLEMVVDCVMAGRARSKDGKLYPIKVPNELLQTALTNTVALLNDVVEIEGE